MASNFNFTIQKIGDSLHLKLYGDFDGTSACELTNSFQKYYKKPYQIFIDTNDLRIINPFGIDIMQRKVGSLERFVFIGMNKKEFLL